ncbi:hypothetical protein [Geminocystis sp. GBBB08]|uniref:hypothetical protein n=1 Tax=Geminocystis sp. GBBB08 TaxID=2604140 RepID=UPI0027E2A1AE|nr:hypothetical protein [Geminocystis sp. GBBB08]MBL1209928.1 hypothetical protein [Geminocystis sp. GBBB08]
MSLPILQPSSKDTTQIRGDVTIDQSVIIAPGVILNATFGHKIILRQGVCVGMGTIITAYEGDIIIQENTILGSGTLILGNCTIGSQVSLGASVTVYHSNIEAMSVVPAGSIIGDRSRQVNLKKEVAVNTTPPMINSPTQTIINGVKKGFSTNLGKENISVNNQEEENRLNINQENEEIMQPIEEIAPEIEKKEKESSTFEVENKQETETEILNNDIWEEKTPQGNTIVGKVYINKLLFTLFPDKHKT